MPRSPLILALVWPLSAFAAPATEDVFARHRDAVVQVRVLEAGSGTKASIGSGFTVSGDGLVVTNFHVVSELVHRPALYRADAVRADKSELPFTLLSFDVVNDLALGRVAGPSPALALAPRPPAQGTRLYSFGNPMDLGPTIVEGTHNGPVDKSFYDRYHLTASLNPGMSGGPTITADGRVIGVNVATAGEQVGFLVPVGKAADLLARSAARGHAPEADFLALLRDQLLANQEKYMAKLLAAPFETVNLEGNLLPGALSPAFKCWADQPAPERRPYALTVAQCATQESLFLSSRQETGTIAFRHTLLKNRRLNAGAFSALVEEHFSDARGGYGGEEDLGNFSCAEDFVDAGGAVWKAAACLSAYRKLPGLYDVTLSAATLPRDGRSLVTQLTLTGVSERAAADFLRKTWETLRWKKPGT